MTQWTPRDAGKPTGGMKKSVKELRKTVCQMSRCWQTDGSSRCAQRTADGPPRLLRQCA